jgi:hypothetical protein
VMPGRSHPRSKNFCVGISIVKKAEYFSQWNADHVIRIYLLRFSRNRAAFCRKSFGSCQRLEVRVRSQRGLLGVKALLGSGTANRDEQKQEKWGEDVRFHATSSSQANTTPVKHTCSMRLWYCLVNAVVSMGRRNTLLQCTRGSLKA